MMLASKPDQEVRMIPVGPLIAEVIEEFLGDLPVTELYEDDAPHGRANLYFLAGLVSYMSIYEEKAAAVFEIPALIDDVISNQYVEIVDYMWDYLLAFNDTEGNSRVFTSEVSSATELFDSKSIIYPNPVSETLFIKSNLGLTDATIRNVSGIVVTKVSFNYDEAIDVSNLATGVYFLEIQTNGKQAAEILKFVKGE